MTGQDGEQDGALRLLHGPNGTIEIPFHASCSKCHHLHTNKRLRLFLNALNHVRFRCDKCEHHMFGIGRTSTQTTLASVESISSPPRSNRNSYTLRPSPRQICVSPPAEEVQTSHPTSPENLTPQPPLSTIDESHTPGGRSRSSSLVQSPDDTSVRPEGTTISSSAGGLENSIIRQEQPSEPAGTHQPVQGGRRPFANLKKAWHRARDNQSHGSREKKWGLSRIIKFGSIFTRRSADGPGVPLSPPPQREGAEHRDLAHRGGDPSDEVTSGSAHTRSPSQAPTHDLASSHRVFSPEPSERILDSPTREIDHPASGSGSTTRNSRESETEVDASQPRESDDASQPRESDDISPPSTNAGQQMTEQDAAENKRARLRARRREKTIQSEITARPVCHCRPGCPCHGVNRASGSVVSSETPRTPDSSFEPPEHPLQHLLADAPIPALEPRMSSAMGSMGHLPQTLARIPQLSGIGVHFDSARQRATSSALTQAYRLSQATTIHNGSTSSISLTLYPGQPVSRRPGPSVQSRSPEVIPRQELHASSTRSDPDSDVEGFRHSSEETIADASSIHTGVTAPVSVADAQDRTQASVQGPTASLSIQTANIGTVNGSPASESQTATPRPSSNNELAEEPTTFPQPESAAISSALRDVNPSQ